MFGRDVKLKMNNELVPVWIGSKDLPTMGFMIIHPPRILSFNGLNPLLGLPYVRHGHGSLSVCVSLSLSVHG